jgi:hypothetical protein
MMKDYSININNKKLIPRYQVWLSTTQGDVLIKLRKDKKQNLTIGELTIEAEEISILLDRIEKEWSIKCEMSDLREAYNFKSLSHPLDIYGLIVSKVIQDDFPAPEGTEFIHYRDLDEILDRYDRENDFNESFYSLLAYMDNEYDKRF